MTRTARSPLLIALAAVLALPGCRSRSVGDQRPPEPDSSKNALSAAEPMAPTAVATPAMDMKEMVEDEADQPEKSEQFRPARRQSDRDSSASHYGAGSGRKRPPALTEPTEVGAKTRSWFPETFLFEPLVVTDQGGAAEVTVKVPDRLTTWRVLALAHSRSGAQAGAVTSFLGTLPTYVDPILPPLLRAGDDLRIPIQLVNTTGAPITTDLVLEVDGARATGGAGRITIPAASSLVRYAGLRTDQPGRLRLHARLGQADAVVREVDIQPTGKPITMTRSATLAAPRSFHIAGPAQTDPGTDRVRLQVFPGALAILRTELGAAIDRGGVAEDAFALLLAGKAPELLASLGDQPDAKALRKLTLLATQRAVRHARTLDITSATLLADAALAHPDNPVLANLGQRAVAFIAREQLPDGTCGGETGWTLQRLLVATADCARAAAGQPDVVIRASGAFERHAAEIEDPYTAAAILASGAAGGKLAETLRDKVLAAIEERDSGTRVLVVPDGVVRADGVRPSEVEASALAILALAPNAAPVADLGATVLGGYAPAWGWGDGRTDLVAMQAVLKLFRDPLPDQIAIRLVMDGATLAEGQLDRDHIRDILTLEAEGVASAGDHEWQVVAEPAVAGLGFRLDLISWVEWPPAPSDGGLELQVIPPRRLRVGRPAVVEIRAVAPADQEIHIRQSLPAGVQADTARLDDLVSDGTLSRYDTSDGLIELWAPGLQPAQIFTARYPVIPTLSGRVQTGASSIEVAGQEVVLPPARWTITD